MAEGYDIYHEQGLRLISRGLVVLWPGAGGQSWLQDRRPISYSPRLPLRLAFSARSRSAMAPKIAPTPFAQFASIFPSPRGFPP